MYSSRFFTLTTNFLFYYKSRENFLTRQKPLFSVPLVENKTPMSRINSVNLTVGNVEYINGFVKVQADVNVNYQSSSGENEGFNTSAEFDIPAEKISTIFVANSLAHNYALLMYLKNNRIDLIIDGKLNSLFNKMPGLLKKQYGIDFS